MGGSAVCLWALNTLQRAARHKPLRRSTQERLLLGPEVNWAHHTHPWCGREITATPQRELWHPAPSELRHRRRHRPLLTLTNPKTPLLLRGTLACRDSLACFFYVADSTPSRHQKNHSSFTPPRDRREQIHAVSHMRNLWAKQTITGPTASSL
jgi:hypothetical protein